jgi:hypothetical protein
MMSQHEEQTQSIGHVYVRGNGARPQRESSTRSRPTPFFGPYPSYLGGISKEVVRGQRIRKLVLRNVNEWSVGNRRILAHRLKKKLLFGISQIQLLPHSFLFGCATIPSAVTFLELLFYNFFVLDSIEKKPWERADEQTSRVSSNQRRVRPRRPNRQDGNLRTIHWIRTPLHCPRREKLRLPFQPIASNGRTFGGWRT